MKFPAKGRRKQPHLYNSQQLPASSGCWMLHGAAMASSLVGALLMAIALPPSSALAEGSKDLTNNGGQRPYLEFRTATAGLVPRKTIIKAYAQAGETIELGSSAVGTGNGVINYRKPNGAPGTCGATGLIANRSQEINETFTPCILTVGAGETGIWEIDFVSPKETATNDNSNPPVVNATGNWRQANNVGYVSAWDVTVKNTNGTPILGRVYANYYALNMGDNNIALNSKFTVLTREGYQYRVDLNGLDPFGFIFFANNNGFKETSTNVPIFRSLQYVGPNPGVLPPGYTFQNPNAADTVTDVTHKIFINPPASDLPSSASSPQGLTWLYSLPAPPPTPQNFEFTGSEGTVGQAGSNPLGGFFSFESPAESSYSITLDLNQNGTFGDGLDRTFLGRAIPGNNSVFWDGLDGDGNPLPASTSSYGAQINLYAGEAHFPMVDPENNPNGIIIERLNNPSPPTSPIPNPYTVYYDDRNTGNSASDYSLCASGETGADCAGTGPNPRDALVGTNSQNGAHEFSATFGNRRGINTWVYYPSTSIVLAGGIAIREADLSITKDDGLSSINPGESLTYTLTVKNAGPSNVVGATLSDVVPNKLTNVNWSCTITAGNGACAQASGSGNDINATLNLEKDAIATITVTADVLSTASGTITNTATITRPNDVNDPDLSNNSAVDTTAINAAPPLSGSACYAVAGSSGGTDADRLVQIQISDGGETDIGLLGTTDVKAIAYQPLTGLLYAADGNRFGRLNLSSGQYTNIGRFGSGSGPAGSLNFDNVNGLAFHPFTGKLYGSVRRDNGNEDLLIEINPNTGLHVPDAFGVGIDYLVITSLASTGFDDIDDIVVSPTDAQLYAVANQGGNSTNRYIRVDISDGSVTSLGTIGVTDVESLAAFNDGTVYATSGNDGPAQNHDNFYQLSAAGDATEIGRLALGDDYESLACLTAAINQISGTVFLDPDISATLTTGDSGSVNVLTRLYRDLNDDGTVDGGDQLLSSQLSDSAGFYDFQLSATGSFVLDIDPNSLPPDNNTLTTDNVETANFGFGFGLIDTNNNFGHFTNPSLVLVKRITAINNIQLNSYIDDTYDNPSTSVNEALADNHPHWPPGSNGAGISNYLAGDISRGGVRPAYEVEYTVYFLSGGNFPLTNVNLCDMVPSDTTYVPGSLELVIGSGVTTGLSDASDGDSGEFLSVGNAPAVPCPPVPNSNGAVVVNLAQSPAQLPYATGPGTPMNSYGYIRFRVTVN